MTCLSGLSFRYVPRPSAFVSASFPDAQYYCLSRLPVCPFARQSTADAVDQRLVLTAPKLTTPASRQRKTAIALHAPLLARYDRLRLATPTTPGLRTLVWTQSIGSYCFVYQLGKQRSVLLSSAP